MAQGACLEKRQHSRIAAHIAASIVVPGRAVACIVREISPAGARLQLGDDWILPRGFWLRPEGDTQMHYCTVAWIEGRAVGVEFRPEHRGSWWRHGQNIIQLPHRARI